MSKKDTTSKGLFQNPEVFADFFNTLVLENCKIQPESLRQMDTTLIHNDEKGESSQRVQDVYKMAPVTMQDNEKVYCFFGIENQTKACTYMPVRVLFYNALCYIAQAEGKQPLDDHGTMKKLRVGDKLRPVVSVVLYWGNESWGNNPRSLSEMFDCPELAKFLPQQEMVLIELQKLTQEQIAQLQTELGLVFDIVKNSNNLNELSRIEADPRLDKLSSDAIETIRCMSTYEFKGGNTTMSDVIERRRREMELFRSEVEAEVEAKSKDELDKANARADKANARADKANARADKANARAEAAERELALLKAQLEKNK